MKRNYKETVFYEIYPNSFKDSNGDGYGDLQGIISKLDYIASLGFSGIWLNPIYDSPFFDGGYDIRDFFKVSERFGTEEDLKQLIEECHKRDIRLFLDLVPGHASFENKEFLESAKPERNEYSDLFIWNDNVWANEPGYRLISGLFQRFGCYMVNFFSHQPAINYGFNKVEYPWQHKVGSPEANKGKEFSLAKFNDNLAKLVSCKMSIKANTRITKEAQEEIINKLRRCNNPFNCPHGRPTIIHFTTYEIERMFKRVV